MKIVPLKEFLGRRSEYAHTDYDTYVQERVAFLEAYDKKALQGIVPGTRVKVFDHTLFVDDKKTPKSVTMKPATVLCHYGLMVVEYSEDLALGPYPSMVDVLFDHRPVRESKGHFTYGIELL